MQKLLTSLKIIAIFKNVLKDNLISSFINMVFMLNNKNFEAFLSSYSDFISLLYEKECHQNLYEYIKKLIYTDENILSKGYEYSIEIEKTANFELSLFDELVSIEYEDIKITANENFPEYRELIEHLPAFKTEGKRIFNILDIIKFYRNNGYGIFAGYNAFKFNENKQLTPVKNFKAMNFKQLKNYEYQKEVIYNNTEGFLKGKEANNVLLYGDRGCGKSSTVKALINEFSNYNLKIIQISKESLIYLSDLFEIIRNLPLKFIIFADDISFEENDGCFSSIKASLEGSLSEKPLNTIIYATTNRMHLVKESFSSREGNEIHYNDTIDEMVSLSDRFGIVLTFSILTRNEYLDIVGQMANDCKIEINDDFINKAEQFAMLKGIRTPRIAKQFITDYKH